MFISGPLEPVGGFSRSVEGFDVLVSAGLVEGDHQPDLVAAAVDPFVDLLVVLPCLGLL